MISSIMQDMQPEIVAAPQVETTVTEPDDLGDGDVEPVDLVEAVPAAVGETAIAGATQPSAEPGIAASLPADTGELANNETEMAPVPPADATVNVAELGSEATLVTPSGDLGSELALSDETPIIPSVENGPGAEAEPVAQMVDPADVAALPPADSEVGTEPDLAAATGQTIDSASGAGVAPPRTRARHGNHASRHRRQLG